MGTTLLTDAGAGVGDEVVLPAFGGFEAAEAVRQAGARPVFADIEPDTFCLDPASVENVVTERTAAIVPVHLFGYPADLVRLRKVAEACDAELVGFGTVPQPAAVDAVRRRQHAEYLHKRLTGVVIPGASHGQRHAYTDYVVRVPGNGRPDRDAFKRALRARGVECYVPVRTPVHRMPDFRVDVHLPETERAADETLALPIRASMVKRDLHRIVSACNALGGLVLGRAC